MASIICPALGRGVTRSKRQALQWCRKAAENGYADACMFLAQYMYEDRPSARQVGHVVEAAGVATAAGITEEHGVPPYVLSDVVHWLQKGGHDPIVTPYYFRRLALEGGTYCVNVGCKVVGLLKEFRVCPQCKTARYCGDACQKADWTTGGHKLTCCTFAHSRPPVGCVTHS
jgi:hypothetical protein